jgi:hypothetical protein
MKRAMRFLARLYPSSWRERYGSEFDALLEDSKPSAQAAFDVLSGALKMHVTTWSFGRITLAGTVTGIIVAVALSLALPAHYLTSLAGITWRRSFTSTIYIGASASACLWTT